MYIVRLSGQRFNNVVPAFCVCGVKNVRVRRDIPDGLVARHRGLGLRLDDLRRLHRLHVDRPREPVFLEAPSAVRLAAEIRDVSLISSYLLTVSVSLSRRHYAFSDRCF